MLALVTGGFAYRVYEYRSLAAFDQTSDWSNLTKEMAFGSLLFEGEERVMS